MKTIATLLILALASTTLAADTCTAANKCIHCGADTTCTAVSEGYKDTDGSMKSLTATNCKVGSAAAVCTTCNPGYALVTNTETDRDAINTCMEIVDSNKGKQATGYDKCAAFTVEVAAKGSETNDVYKCVSCTNGKIDTTAGNFCQDTYSSVTKGECTTTNGTVCSGCASGYTLLKTEVNSVTTYTCDTESKDALEGCLDTEDSSKCTGSCDAANSYFATKQDACTKASTSSKAAILASIIMTISLLFAIF